MWKDSWVHDTQCPEFKTYLSGWKFSLQAFAKVVRGSVTQTEPIWPLSSFTDAIYDWLLFPDDKWPQELLHGSNHWPYTSVCVLLNSAVWLSVILVLVLLYHQATTLMYFALAHVLIFQECLQDNSSFINALERGIEAVDERIHQPEEKKVNEKTPIQKATFRV